jgi:raffinose/stachyose/melibiose transport system substrate-binding protein
MKIILAKYLKRKWEYPLRCIGKIGRSEMVVIALILNFSLLLGCSPTIHVDGEIPYQSIYRHDLPRQDDQEIVLTIYYGTIHNAPMMDAIARDYEELTGVRIEWQAADGGGVILRGLFATGRTPDLFQLTLSDLAMWENYLADLSNQPWIDDVYDISLQTATVNGRIFSWPHTLEASGIVYNRDLFRQGGIEAVPTTLDELWQVVYQLENAGIQSFGEAWMQFGYLAHLLSVPFNFEPDVAAISEKILQGEASFGDLRYIDEYFEIFNMTIDYGWGEDSIGYNTLDQHPDFAAGRMAMIKQGTWVEGRVLIFNEDLNIGIFPVPISNNPNENKLQLATTTGVSVNRYSENLEAALEFLNWWHENAQKYLVDIDRVVPPFKSVDISGLGALNQDMDRYIEKGMVFEGFGWEYWPQGFMVQLAEPLQAYAARLQSQEETIRQLDVLFRMMR